VLGLVAFVTGEALQPELTNLRDSLAAAESQFSKESDQSTLSLQILNMQQQMELLQTHKSDRDYSALIAEDTALAQQVTASLNADFDAFSSLVDALPARLTDMRGMRDEIRTGVEAVDKNSKKVLASTSDHGANRYALVVSAKLFAIVEHIPMVIAADDGQTVARQVIAAYDSLIRICMRTAYVCGLLAAALFVYSAIARGRPIG
jgi:hypothetical protein